MVVPTLFLHIFLESFFFSFFFKKKGIHEYVFIIKHYESIQSEKQRSPFIAFAQSSSPTIQPLQKSSFFFFFLNLDYHSLGHFRNNRWHIVSNRQIPKYKRSEITEHEPHCGTHSQKGPGQVMQSDSVQIRDPWKNRHMEPGISGCASGYP